MERAKKTHRHEERGKQLKSRKFTRANGSKVGCLNIPASNRKTQRGDMTTLDGHGDHEVTNAHELPRVVQLNLKPSLMGVQIYDDSEHFFSRQSSTASMVLEKCQSGVAMPCFSGREQGDGLKTKRALSIVTSSDAGKRAESGSTHNFQGDSSRLENRPRNRPPTVLVNSFEKARAASGTLYPPCAHVAGNTNSSILNAVHFTLGDASATESGHVTDKIYKQLLEQARSQKCTTHGIVRGLISETTPKSSSDSAHHQVTQSLSSESVVDRQYSPVNTLVSSSTSLTFSERLFGYEFSRDSFRRQSQRDHAKSAGAPSQLVLPNTRQLNCTSRVLLADGRQLHNNSTLIIPAGSDYEDTDDDDIIIEGDIIFEIPSEASPFHCSHGQHHYAELQVMVGAKPRPSSEQWSSNKKAFHVNLEQQQSIQHRFSTTADPDAKAREKLDVSHRDISVRSSCDEGSRRLKTSLTELPSFASERGSEWLGFESDMDDYVLDSGRLKIDVSRHSEPDHADNKPFMEQVNNKKSKKKTVQAGDVAKVMDEDDFPFDSPIASWFLFEEPGGKKKRSEDHAQPAISIAAASTARPVTTVLETMDSFDDRQEDLDLSDDDDDDAFHDPEDGSISDTDSSSLTTFSLEADSSQGQMDAHTQWISTRSFNYLREVVDHNSGFLNIESRSGRFSVDLRQEKRLESKPVSEHPGGTVHNNNNNNNNNNSSLPGVTVSLRRSAQSSTVTNKSSRRSLLAPCLVCLSCIHQRPAQKSQQTL